jgi:hypothetical protein
MTTEAPSASQSAPSGQDERQMLLQGFDNAERELETSASDCDVACRALASMERATSQLCAIGDEPADRQRCDDARTRLHKARSRVRATCNSCPGGPSVDPDAPLPPP